MRQGLRIFADARVSVGGTESYHNSSRFRALVFCLSRVERGLSTKTLHAA